MSLFRDGHNYIAWSCTSPKRTIKQVRQNFSILEFTASKLGLQLFY